MREICGSVQEFSRFDLSRVALSIGVSRSSSKHGVWAYVTPLRYVGGGLYRKGLRRGIPGHYTYQLGNKNLEEPDSPLYLITILVPRFFSLSFEERIETLVHELYHLHPEFRGDLRRFAKPHVHHGPTPAAFNRKVRELVAECLQRRPELREHPLLTGSPEGFGSTLKRRVSRPVLRFVPKFLPLFLALSSMSSALAQEPLGSEERYWLWPWEKTLPDRSSKTDNPLFEELRAHDQQRVTQNKNPRFVVSPTELLSLKTAPSEWSENLLDIKPGENFLAFTTDSSGEWVFLRSRKVQGWVRAEKVQVVGNLQAPDAAGKVTESGADSASHVTSRTRLDGDPLLIPEEGDIDERDLLNFDRDLDSITATRGGPLHEQPDPLSVRFGSIQPGDSVLILKRGARGDWAYVRLILTGEEGWYPSDWLRITRGRRVSGAGRGILALDMDGVYGNAGRNYGLGGGAFVNLLGGRGTQSARFEVGALVQNFNGEKLSHKNAATGESYELTTGYMIYGVGLRWVGFAPGGFLGGAIEGAGTYQRASGRFHGLSDEVIAESGLAKALRPRFGLMIGARGLLSVTSWLQVNTLVRMNIAPESNLFWAGMGLSFRIF
jgi:hypothetical protein